MSNRQGMTKIGLALIGLVVGLVIVTSVLSATMGLILGGFSDVANNVSAGGGNASVVSGATGLSVFFSIVLPLLAIIGFFLLLWRIIQKTR